MKFPPSHSNFLLFDYKQYQLNSLVNRYQGESFRLVSRMQEWFSFIDQTINLMLKTIDPFQPYRFLWILFEKLFHTRLYQFLKNFKVFFDDQKLFLKNKPTTDVIFKSIDES